MPTPEQSEAIQAKLREVVALMGACSPEEAAKLPGIFAALNVVIPDPKNPEFGLRGTFTVGTTGVQGMAALVAYITYTLLSFAKSQYPDDETKQAEIMAEYDAACDAAMQCYVTKQGVQGERMDIRNKPSKKKGG